MSGDRPKAVYEPGELDRTRQNLGLLDEEEAKRMMKTLGGTVGVEKSRPLDESKLPAKRSATRVVQGKISDTPGGRTSSGSVGAQAASYAQASKPAQPRFSLPSVPAKVKQAMDDILISYGIKPKPVFLAAIFKSLRSERLSHQFLTGMLPNTIKNMEVFNSSVKSMIQNTTPDFKERLKTDTTSYYRSLQVISTWDIESINKQYSVVSQHESEMTVVQLIPLIRMIYGCLYKLYFLGESRVKEIIQKLFMDVSRTYPEKAESTQIAARSAATSWLYLYEHTLSRFYPLLMRMCCNDIIPYPEIMRSESSRILSFLGLTKFDLVFPDKDPPAAKVDEKAKQEEERQEKQKQANLEQVVRGMKMLDTMFPDAGFLDLSSMPDLFPYFQPLYQFPDGFNYLNRENPLQVIVVLLRIIEDFLMGFRNVSFQTDDTLDGIMGDDSISRILTEWVEYREVLFEKKYATILREYVGNLTASMEYAGSSLGKKMTSNLLWFSRNQFLPGLQFDLRFLDRPEPDKMLPQLGRRTAKLKSAFDYILMKSVQAYKENPKEANKRKDLGIQGIFNPYSFPMPNMVSRRLDVLLGGKNSKNTNVFNLVKYTNQAIIVLDWWINNADSPAYQVDAEQIYRKDNGGKPIFSIPTRNDQNEVFSQSIKKAAAARAPSGT